MIVITYVYFYKLLMTSLIDEDTTIDYQNIGKEVMTHMKTYNFFVYYQRNHLGHSYASMNL